MMILGLIGMVGLFCWLIFKLTVHALPAFVGISAGLMAHETGAGPVGAVLIACVVGGAVFGLGQTLFARLCSPVARTALCAVFVLPAAYAAYHAAHGIAASGTTSESWSMVLALASAAIVGFVAWQRLGDLARTETGTGIG